MRRLLYLVPVFLLLTSCIKTKDANPTPFNVPDGNFSGKFLTLHKNTTTGKYDTTKTANLQLYISTSSGYKVTGDTATVHAGSYGDFAMDPNYIQFLDKTVAAGTGVVPNKVHLNGVYQYYFDGSTVFQLQQAYLDTLVYQYDFRKQ